MLVICSSLMAEQAHGQRGLPQLTRAQWSIAEKGKPREATEGAGAVILRPACHARMPCPLDVPPRPDAAQDMTRLDNSAEQS